MVKYLVKCHLMVVVKGMWSSIFLRYQSNHFFLIENFFIFVYLPAYLIYVCMWLVLLHSPHNLTVTFIPQPFDVTIPTNVIILQLLKSV